MYNTEQQEQNPEEVCTEAHRHVRRGQNRGAAERFHGRVKP